MPAVVLESSQDPSQGVRGLPQSQRLSWSCSGTGFTGPYLPPNFVWPLVRNSCSCRCNSKRRPSRAASRRRVFRNWRRWSATWSRRDHSRWPSSKTVPAPPRHLAASASRAMSSIFPAHPSKKSSMSVSAPDPATRRQVTGRAFEISVFPSVCPLFPTWLSWLHCAPPKYEKSQWIRKNSNTSLLRWSLCENSRTTGRSSDANKSS